MPAAERVVTMASEGCVWRLDGRRKTLKTLACFAAGLIAVALSSPDAIGQAASADAAHKIDDAWQGTLHSPNRDIRLVLKIAKADAGALKATFYNIDQAGQSIAASSASFQDGALKCSLDMIDGSYEGKMSADGKSISGTWKQGPNSLSLLLERATPATAWTIPEPPPRLPPMAADANPSFEVATIKPSQPDRPGKMFGVRGSHFNTINTTLLDLITFAYGVQQKQVVGAPDWVGSEKWDIEAQPDVPGAPNPKQLKTMVQKLLTDRFQLKFHQEKKELPAYVLSVAKDGSKMTKSDSDQALPGLFFSNMKPVTLTVRNAVMTDFTQLLQSAVLDRPVVDQTGLSGRWNFLLKWTADESQFGGMGVKVPAPDDAADAPPPLFTAIQEQIGLKLDAGKAQVEVLAVDKVEKPSAN